MNPRAREAHAGFLWVIAQARSGLPDGCRVWLSLGGWTGVKKIGRIVLASG
jgi:hypothetical protein